MTSVLSAACVSVREMASAQLDGEFLDETEVTIVDGHLHGCSPCTHWVATARAMHRSLRLSASEEVPDLTAKIMASVRREQFIPTAPPVLPMARLGLVVTAFAILLGVMGEILGATGWTSTHTSQELLGFQIALAGGFAGAALRPRWAGGVALSSVITAAVLVITAFSGVRSGETTGTIEFNHVLEVVGAALCCVIARLAGSGRRFSPGESRRLTT
jgi:predicted anti-sigma-YlaC factor YlaD